MASDLLAGSSKLESLPGWLSIRLQRFCGWFGFLMIGPFVLWLIKRKGYNFPDQELIRSKFREIRHQQKKHNKRNSKNAENPHINQKRNLLICANHLTMIDSVILQTYFASFWHSAFHYGDFAWNVPAQEVFANRWYFRVVLYLSKCIPIDRMGSKQHHEKIVQQMKAALDLGDPFIVFPEGGRSRTGRFDMERLTYGIGRLLKEDKNLEVLCVYLRSDKQDKVSDLPPVNSNFYCNFELLKPQTDQKGLRADRDLAMQVGHKIQELEEQYFNLKSI